MGTRRSRGFTLIELSIVLVVIGLIVAGVLGGRELIRAAQIRKQIGQMQDYQTAYNTFRNKYNCIPGDCTDPSRFWPDLIHDINDYGNGMIDVYVGTPEGDPEAANNLNNNYDNEAAFWSGSYELQYFFMQLSRAGLISGNFDGSRTIGQGLPTIPLGGGSTVSFIPGSINNFNSSHGPPIHDDQTVPRTGTNGLWYVVCSQPEVGDPNEDYMHTWDNGTIDPFNGCGVFRPIDLSNMDTKLDDGMPLSGKLFGFGSPWSNSCLVASGGTYRYNMTVTDTDCQAAFMF